MFQKIKTVSRPRKLGVLAIAILLISTFSSAPQSKPTSINVQRTNSTDIADKHIPAEVTSTQTETQPIPFATTTVETNTLPKGTSKVTTAGAEGISTLTYKVVTIEGKEASRTLVSQITTTQPVTQVTSLGTYIAPAPPKPNCDHNYSGCVPIASDVDCAGGSGNGPAYAHGPVRVIGYDIYDLDRDGNKIACE